MKRLLCILLSIVLIGSILLCAHGESAKAKESFAPVLRFVAASDTHVRDEDDFTCPRITSMMETAYRLAEEDSTHPTLDAVLLCGDLTNAGTVTEFQKFGDRISSSLRSETELLAIVAKNHDGYHLSRTKERAAISAITGKDADFHVTINGYHFIGLSVSSKKTSHYDKGQLSWLKEQLDAATAENPNQPVFVMHHEHVKNTVYGSSSFERWGVPYFNDILEQYPQVVDFSGHSHYPLNHPNSVWQGAFTAINTGAVKSTDYTVEDLRDIASSPSNRECSTYWIVEIDKNNRMRLRGMDLLAEEVLCEYVLDNPADPANRAFSPENKAAASTAPVFAPGSTMSATVQKGHCTVTASLAESTDNFPVVLYRAYAMDSKGKVVAETWTQPQYFVANAPDTVELTLKGLSKGEYTVYVVAETAYGVQSEPMHSTAVTVISPGAFSAFFSRIGLWIAHKWDVAINAIF